MLLALTSPITEEGQARCMTEIEGGNYWRSGYSHCPRQTLVLARPDDVSFELGQERLQDRI